MKKLPEIIILIVIFIAMIAAFLAVLWEPLSAHGEELLPPTTVSNVTAITPGPPALIVVHRTTNICHVYDANGQLLNIFIVSTGREGHRTPLGTYSIYEHSTGAGYHLMVDGTYGRFCMRFKKGGYMFHSVCYAYPGAPEPLPEEVLALGTSVSRGCVRLSPTDAEWLYNNTPNGCVVSITDD